MKKIQVISGSKAKEYNLVAYFKIVGSEEKFIMYNTLNNVTNLYLGKLKIEKNDIKIVKLNEKELGLIDRIIIGDKSVKYRKVPSRDLEYLVYSNSTEKIVTRKEYNNLIESSLVKTRERDSRLKEILKEKEELQKELDRLKKENNIVEEVEVNTSEKADTSWEHVKEESRYITDDSLLSNIEHDIKDLELDEFYEKCKINIVRVITVNIISLILVAIFLYGSIIINYMMDLLGKEALFTNVYLSDVLKMYAVASLSVLLLQIITLGTHRNFFSRLAMFIATVIFIYTFTQMVNGYSYSFGVIVVFLMAVINIIINFSLYLQLQLKLM